MFGLSTSGILAIWQQMIVPICTTDMIMNKIADLLPLEYQGIYRDKGSDETDGYFAKDKSTA